MPGEAEVIPSDQFQADQFQADPLLRLLTDALREGPGSPAWHGAIERLNKIDAAGDLAVNPTTSQYRRLCQAREHLESGKEFRSIRPGPGFTARLWSALDSQGASKAWDTRGLLTAFAAACVLLGCVAVIWQMIPRGSAIDRDTASLSTMLFTRPLASINPSDLSQPDWRAVGASPLSAAEVIPQGVARTFCLPLEDHRTPPTGGGFALVKPLDAGTAFAIEARFQLNKVDADIVPELAVSDVDDFTAVTATSPHELLFALEGKQAKIVAPSGRLIAQTELPGDGRGELTVRFRVNRQAVIIEMNGRNFFAGELGLSLTGDRYVAARILRRGGSSSQDVALRSIQALVGQ